MEKQWVKIPNTNYIISNYGDVKHAKTNKIVKPYTTPTSDRLYVTVRFLGNKGKKNINIAREVALAFIPKIEGKDYVNHIDGNKYNNRVDNLEWCTRSENEKHAFATGLKHSTKGMKYKRRK